MTSKFILMTSRKEVNELFQLGRLHKPVSTKVIQGEKLGGKGGMIRVEGVVSGRWL
jgi:hypothetical protein